MRVPDLFVSADQLMTSLVSQVTETQWDGRVPTTPKWSVVELVAHGVDENRWVGDMLAGRRIADVKDQYATDPIDAADPLTSWNEASESAQAAVLALADLDRTVHLSFGDTTAEEYLQQMVIDRLIHSWDLARAIDAPTDLPVPLVEAAWTWFEPQAESWRSAGMLGAAIAVPDNADTQSKLLALSGRDARPQS